MDKRKMLFVLFTEDVCTQRHALNYALDLKERGHQVKLIIEGKATSLLLSFEEEGSQIAQIISQLQEKDILLGACHRASGGCNNPSSVKQDIAKRKKITLLDDLNGHAGIGSYIDQGYELIVF